MAGGVTSHNWAKRPTPRRRPLGAVVAAGLFLTVVSACGNGGGGAPKASPNTPQQAVTQLLTALDQGDYGAAVNALTPGESAAMHDQLGEFASQLVRLGLLAPGTSLSHVPGVSFTFSNPTFAVAKVGTGLDLVTFTGGTVTSSVDPSKLPAGPEITQAFGPLINKAQRSSQQSPLGPKPQSGPPAGLAVLQVGSHWYVSLDYTIAENARRSGDLPTPDPSGAVAPAGANSPDAAVSALLKAAASLDLRRMLALAPPDELGAAQNYASLYLPKAEAAIAQLQGVSIQVNGVSFGDQSKSDGTLVRIKSLNVSANVKGTQVTYAGGCLTVNASGAKVQFCQKDLPQLFSGLHAPAAASQLVTLLLGVHPDSGIMTVRENGQWYVSPTRTLIDNVNAYLAALSPSQVDQIFNDIQQLQNSAANL